MEPFYLSDIRAVTSNKTIERIISPMAAQLCHLMIAAEWDGVNNEHLADLEKAAEELAKATEELAYVARRVAHESNDELLAGEMLLAAESLLASGRSILLVAQKLHIQPDIQRHQEELIDSAKRVLMETVKLLIDSPNDSKSTSSEQGKGATLAALPEDAGQWQDDSNKMSQVAKEMAIGMSHMARFLKRKGPITTKEQLIACATQMASNGQMFVRFGHLIAKNCLDERCATELLCVTEQIQTISNQLRIISRVKAATAGSKCSAELLVNNAQNLFQVVLQSLKAAEAACVKGLRKPDPDSEEAEAAAFCIQWKKKLLWHRVKETLNPERDEFGLRRTRAGCEPTLTSVVQEPSSQN
ncbi:uncharacterized protein ACDP82_003992 isoform 3-T3 [Pangshura tecta]